MEMDRRGGAGIGAHARREKNDSDTIPKESGSMTNRTEQAKGREASPPAEINASLNSNDKTRSEPLGVVSVPRKLAASSIHTKKIQVPGAGFP